MRACLAWGALGFGVALGSIPHVVGEARLLVGIASVLFPAAAVGAALAVAQDHPRRAGLLLVVSAATPTYFAWVLNIPALIVGLVLIVVPQSLIGHDRMAPKFTRLDLRARRRAGAA